MLFRKNSGFEAESSPPHRRAIASKTERRFRGLRYIPHTLSPFSVLFLPANDELCSKSFLSSCAAASEVVLPRSGTFSLSFDVLRLKLQVERLENWRRWEADAETVIELCGEEGEGDDDTSVMLDEGIEASSQPCGAPRLLSDDSRAARFASA